MILSLAALIISSSAIAADSARPAFDTTQVLLTPERLTQIATVLDATTEERAKPEIQARLRRDPIEYTIDVPAFGLSQEANFRGRHVPAANYIVIGDSVPAFKTAFATAGITGELYLRLARSIACAVVTDALDITRKGGPQYQDTTTIIGKNVAFLRAHRADFDALRAKGLPGPTMNVHVKSSGS